TFVGGGEWTQPSQVTEASKSRRFTFILRWKEALRSAGLGCAPLAVHQRPQVVIHPRRVIRVHQDATLPGDGRQDRVLYRKDQVEVQRQVVQVGELGGHGEQLPVEL